MRGANALRLPLFLLGIAIIFASERYIYPYQGYRLCLALGCLSAVLSVFLTYLLYKNAKARAFDQEAKTWILVMSWKIIISIGVVGYFFDQKLAPLPLHSPPMTVFLILWLSLLALGAFLACGIELNLRNLGQGKNADSRALSHHSRIWLSIGLLGLGLAALNYSAAKNDRAYDLSYFKSTRPGPETLKLLGGLTAPIRVGLFFAKDSEVLPFVKEYVEALAKHSAYIQVEVFEKDFAPLQAEDFRVTQNGQVVLAKDSRRQSLNLGDKIEIARKNLQNLDSQMEAAIRLLSSESTPIYFAQRHGEMRWGQEKDPDSRSLQKLVTILRAQNYNPVLFSQSLTQIPSDAAVVAIVGPISSLDRDEIESLRRYLTQGGKLYIALDIAALGETTKQTIFSEQAELAKLLSEFGMHYRFELLANDREFVQSTQQKIDRFLLHTNAFADHDSVADLTKNGQKINVLAMQTGYLIVENAINNWQPKPIILSLPSTFVDRNGNLEFDLGEVRGSYTLAAVAEKTQIGGNKARVIVLADANMLSDPPLAYSGNQQMALANFNWLADRINISAKIEAEEDLKILHAQGQKNLVFHASIFLVPSLILAVGAVLSRRQKYS